MKNLTTNTTFNSKWIEFTYPLNNKIITKDLIKKSLELFWTQIIKTELISEDKVFTIQFKVKLRDGIIRSISKVQTVNSKDFDTLVKLFISFWEIKSDEYQLSESLEIILNYNLFKEKNFTKNIYKPHLLKSEEKSLFNFKGYKLPNTMDLTLWGDYIFTKDYSSAIVYKPNSEAIYHITLFDDHQLVELK